MNRHLVWIECGVELRRHNRVMFMLMWRSHGTSYIRTCTATFRLVARLSPRVGQIFRQFNKAEEKNHYLDFQYAVRIVFGPQVGSPPSMATPLAILYAHSKQHSVLIRYKQLLYFFLLQTTSSLCCVLRYRGYFLINSKCSYFRLSYTQS